VGFDYVGISLDGLKDTHDRFRRKEGAFEAALNGIRLCRDAGAKVGMRFTLTQDNAHDFPALLDLMEDGEHRQVLPLPPQLRRPRQQEQEG
jgi:MoaA/NifB/PqqE/SkfB family radical SAM enzyme